MRTDRALGLRQVRNLVCLGCMIVTMVLLVVGDVLSADDRGLGVVGVVGVVAGGWEEG
ncbi:MAG: hypothetical protein HQL07_08755, partial [Nitrospirae bacterium]|nr:hypothetical protein [Magnetococcales bacterium]